MFRHWEGGWRLELSLGVILSMEATNSRWEVSTILAERMEEGGSQLCSPAHVGS